MSIENSQDPRTTLVRTKYFSLHPKPLEQWLWQQGLPQAAERVFWLHWEEGMKSGDWCSEIPLKRVARECCVDPSTVTRAYQVLKARGLLRRADPGRNPHNPFQQATAITEVRLPRELLVELCRSPNRPRPVSPPSLRTPAATTRPAPLPHDGGAPKTHPQASTEAPRRLDRAATATLLRKLTDAERAAFFVASRDRRVTLTFDEGTLLSPEEQGALTALLRRISAEIPAAFPGPTALKTPHPTFAKHRRLSPLDAARLRRNVQALVPGPAAGEVFGQVLWSVEEGALRRFEPRLATNIALKKIREGAWTKPNRMPPNWLRGACPETCSAA